MNAEKLSWTPIDLINLPQVQRFLGRRSRATIYRWIKEAGLPAHRINRRLYFDRAEVREWFEARRLNAAEERKPTDASPNP